MFKYIKGFINKPQQVRINQIDYTNEQDYNIPEYQIPIDDQGYLQSFSINQLDEYKKFFNDYGFVIINNCLNDQQCQDTIDDIWEYVETENWRYHAPDELMGIKRNDPLTWEKWTSMAQSGIVGGPPVFTKQSVENRANINIYNVYSNLLGRTDLHINHDRYGFFRPTTNLSTPFPKMTCHHEFIIQQENENNNNDNNDNDNGSTFNKPSWKTIYNLHLDMNPFGYFEEMNDEMRKRIISNLEYEFKSSDFIIENNEVGNSDLDELHIQGLINLADNLKDDGGFILIPGFPNHFKDWTLKNSQIKQNNGTKNKFIIIPENNPIHSRVIRTTARAGSLILWNQKMTHGSSPNQSSRPRFTQFIKMTPQSFWPTDKLTLRSNRIKQYTNSFINDLNLADNQKKVIGLLNY